MVWGPSVFAKKTVCQVGPVGVPCFDVLWFFVVHAAVVELVPSY